MSASGWKVRWRRIAEMGPQSGAETFLFLLLLPVAVLYSLIVKSRLALYRRGWLSVYKASVPVVSVGNLSVGGTGKTPVVDHLLRHLLSNGERPAVVSRGYGGTIKEGVAVVAEGRGGAPQTASARCGDEPYLLALRNPRAIVVVAPRRRDGVRYAIEALGATVVLLDDAFQHLAVERDLDLVLLDARRPFGNWRLLPAGLLREPVSSLLRADLLIFTRATNEVRPTLPLEQAPVQIRSYHLLDRHFGLLDGGEIDRNELIGKRCVAFAGIADPDGFFDQLRALGLNLVAVLPLDDHVRYDERLLAQLEALSGTADFFVTTEKDGVKLRSNSFSRPCCQARLTLEFAPQGALEAAIDALFVKESRAQ